MSDVLSRARRILDEAPAAMAAAGETRVRPGVVPELLAEAERLQALVARAADLLREHVPADAGGRRHVLVDLWLSEAAGAPPAPAGS